jgi:hypothetical protein
MHQTKNIFVQQKKREIEALKRQLLEHNYAGGYGGSIDLLKVNNIIDGLLVEVLKLQTENETLAGEINKLLKEKETKPDENES